ncbi:hypothetical protein N8Z33_02390, partial [Flavobacteriaceae bacterium]|nr:hypothetical protein [Flavobacteriaceae bacterium]
MRHIQDGRLSLKEAVCRKQLAGSRLQGAVSSWQEAGSSQQNADSRKQLAVGSQQDAVGSQQDAGSRLQGAVSSWQEAGSSQQDAGSRLQDAVGSQQDAVGRKQLAESSQQLAGSRLQDTVNSQQDTEKLPTDILLTEPLLTNPLPTDLLPTDLLHTVSLHTDPLPTDLLPTDPLPTDPLPTDLLPTDPLPTDILPTTSRLLTYCLLFFILLSTKLFAQIYPVNASPILIPPYSLKISDYQTTAAEKLFVNLLLTDVSEQQRQVRLRMTIEGQGFVIRNSDVVIGASPIFLDGGINTRLSNLDLRPYFELQNLQGISPQQYQDPLPDGLYRFCFEVFDFFSGQPLSSANGCAMAYLQVNDPPYLNLPTPAELIPARIPQNIIFNWTPRHLNATNVDYEFTIKELWDKGQNPQAAFLASPVWFQRNTRATTLLLGPGDAQLLEGKTYAWRVRAIVSDGISETSVFRNDGYSEIYHFVYQEECKPPEFISAEAPNSQSIKVSWQNSDHSRYRVQYRKKGYGDDDWFAQGSN